MALTCQNCQTVNPDGNAFCQNCGKPMAGAPAAPAAPVAAPVAPGPQYAPAASPYVAQGVPGPALHRSSGTVIIAAVVGGLILLGGGGLLVSHIIPQPVKPPVPSPVAPVASPIPAFSPQPQSSPSPLPQPSPTQPGGNGGTAGQICSKNNTVCLQVPSGWTTSQGDFAALVGKPNSGAVLALSGKLNNASDGQSEAVNHIKSLAAKYPDVTDCNQGTNIKIAQAGLAGKQGYVSVVCYTDTQNQNAPTVEFDFYATSQDGSTLYHVAVYDSPQDYDNFIKDPIANQVVAAIKWAL